MSGKSIRSIMAALLALVMTFNVTAGLVSIATQAALHAETPAMEHGTTGS